MILFSLTFRRYILEMLALPFMQGSKYHINTIKIPLTMVILWYYNGNIMVLSSEEERTCNGFIAEVKRTCPVGIIPCVACIFTLFSLKM